MLWISDENNVDNWDVLIVAKQLLQSQDIFCFWNCHASEEQVAH